MKRFAGTSDFFALKNDESTACDASVAGRRTGDGDRSDVVFSASAETLPRKAVKAQGGDVDVSERGVRSIRNLRGARTCSGGPSAAKRAVVRTRCSGGLGGRDSSSTHPSAVVRTRCAGGLWRDSSPTHPSSMAGDC